MAAGFPYIEITIILYHTTLFCAIFDCAPRRCVLQYPHNRSCSAKRRDGTCSPKSESCAPEMRSSRRSCLFWTGAPSAGRNMLTIHEGWISSVPAAALYSGVCKVNAAIAAQVLIDSCRVEAIINAGTAGGIDPSISIFDTVISTETAYHDVAEDILTEFHPWMDSIWFQGTPSCSPWPPRRPRTPAAPSASGGW